MKLRRILLTVWPTIFAAVPAGASTEKDGQIWLRATVSGSIGRGWNAGVESVLRFGDDANGLYEAEYGGSIGYQLREGVTLSAGYLYVPDYEEGAIVRREHRLRQQLSLALGRLGGGKLNGRLRAEQRLINGEDGLGVRLRPSLAWSLPLRKGGKTALVLSHESFFNLNGTDWGQRGGYERMRNLVAVSTPLAAGVDAEIGYLNQYGFRPNARDTQDHAASLAISYSF